MAEEVGFEPTVPVRVLRFSRPIGKPYQVLPTLNNVNDLTRFSQVGSYQQLPTLTKQNGRKVGGICETPPADKLDV